MFLESKYPKKDLIDFSKTLKNYQRQYRSCDKWNYELEKLCFIGFYFIRKLIESNGTKITTLAINKKVDVVTHPYIKEIGSKLFYWIDDYDLKDKSSQKIKITVKDLSNLFVHSQIFYGIKDGKGLKDIFVTSDKFLLKKIFIVDINTLIDLFSFYGNNYPIKIIQERRKDNSINIYSK